jgi:hypothetical protein
MTNRKTIEMADLLHTDTVNYIASWAEKNGFTYDEALYDIVFSHRLQQRFKAAKNLPSNEVDTNE